jgi:mannose-6-phosphate isomerase-like protein (cupin superfamily)
VTAPAAAALAVKRTADLVAYRISPGDTVRLAVVATPEDGLDATVCFEIWEPGGAQPPNSHPRSVETFYFLAGSGTAHCDGAVRAVTAGDFLVLPPGSTHRIVNTGAGRLYSVTTMSPDAGFAAFVRGGEPVPLDDADLSVFRAGGGAVSGRRR